MQDTFAHTETPDDALRDTAEPSIAGMGLTILKHGGDFALIGPDGNIARAAGNGITGVYHEDMQHISELKLAFAGNVLQTVGRSLADDLSGLEIRLEDITGTLKVTDRTSLYEGALYRRVIFANTGGDSRHVDVELSAGSDCIDMFALRDPRMFAGVYARQGRARAHGPLGVQAGLKRSEHGIGYEYFGLDGKTRHSFVNCSEPLRWEHEAGHFKVIVPPGEEREIFIEAGAGERPRDLPCAARHDRALFSVQWERVNAFDPSIRVAFGDPDVRKWLDASKRDLALLSVQGEQGPIVHAGTPWFCTLFGRDSIVTARQTLWINPAIARGVLKSLASLQAVEDNPDIEAEPGKIPHETRLGESVNAIDPDTGKPYLPFRLYYGGADQTLSFVHLAHAYYARTADKPFMEALWPHIDAALAWAKRKAAQDPDGFVGYAPNGENGLKQQQWEDSDRSVLYEDGDTDVAYPRKASTVQGDLYTAWRGGAAIAALLGKAAEAADLEARADALKVAYNEKFYMAGGFYAHAIDGNGRPCAVPKSAMGRAVESGLVTGERAAAVAERLLSPEFYTGYGIRTLPATAIGYTPEGYHTGSVWPYDTALTASGLAREGFPGAAKHILAGLRNMAVRMDGSLPELVAGYGPDDGRGLVEFPSACKPQAWSAGVVFMAVETALGLVIDAPNQEVRLDPRALPGDWGGVTIENLPVSPGRTVSFRVDADGRLAVLDCADGICIRDMRGGHGMERPAPFSRRAEPCLG